MRLSTVFCVICFLLSSEAHAARLKVVVSFSILGDMVRQVGGEDIELKALIGADSDTHAFPPTPKDAQQLASADLVIINGLGFEGWLERLIVSSGYKGPVIVASKDIPLLIDKHHAHDQIDPHAWQSISNARHYILNIRNALIEADQVHSKNYQQRAQRYLLELDQTEQWIKSEISKIPENNRRIITTHNAFQYYAKAYGVSFISPLGISSDSDASAADVAALIDQLRSTDVKALFLENTSDDRLIHQLRRETGAHIGGTLYSDALSADSGPASSYVALMRHNTMQLIKAMQHNR